MWSTTLSNSPNFLPAGSLFHLYQKNNLNNKMNSRNRTANNASRDTDWFVKDHSLIWKNALNFAEILVVPGSVSSDLFKKRDISTSWGLLGGAVRSISGIAGLVWLSTKATHHYTRTVKFALALIVAEAGLHLLLAHLQGSKGSRAEGAMRSYAKLRLW